MLRHLGVVLLFAGGAAQEAAKPPLVPISKEERLAYMPAKGGVP